MASLSPKTPRARRPVLISLVLLALVAMFYFMAGPSDSTLGLSYTPEMTSSPLKTPKIHDAALPASKQPSRPMAADSSPDLITDTPFMPKMENATLKAELGRASWRLFHTVLARYPQKPSATEQSTLVQYLNLFAQVYPCGDCARHFIVLLRDNPPQVSSRKAAAMWGCMVHNLVNKRLEKPQYDCTTVLEDYDCGCGGDEADLSAEVAAAKDSKAREVEVVAEPLQRGG